MSAIKWSLLALNVLLSSEFCSAHRASVLSEPDPELPHFTRANPSPGVPDLFAWPDLTPPRPAMDLLDQDVYPADDGPPPSPVRSQSGAQGSVPWHPPRAPSPVPVDVPGPYPPPGPIPVDGPYPPEAQSSNPTAGSIMVPPTPLMEGSEPSPATRVPPLPPKAMTSGSTESDASVSCGGGACGGWGTGPPVCGGTGCGMAPPCVPPPKNPYYCQPAGCSASPGFGCGAGGGFTIYLDDRFVEAVSSSRDGGKS